MINVIVKKPNEAFEVKELEWCDKGTIERLIGCDCTDRVKLGPELIMYVDDIGHYKKLPLNFLIETTSQHFPIQEIVGTVVVAKIKINRAGDDFDWVSITKEDIEQFKLMLVRADEMDALLD